MSEPHDATLVLRQLCDGDRGAAERLLPLVYAELRGLAGACFQRQPADHTLQPTALVHEAYLRLIRHEGGRYHDRAHFLAVAATAMRQILTDHARRRRADKRGGEWREVTLDAAAAQGESTDGNARLDIVALDDALRQLETLDPRKHRVVELRFFGGMSVEDVATVMGVSKTTIETEWRAARAWLSRELSK